MRKTPATVVLLVALAAPARAGFDEGMAAYQRGDYATALPDNTELAQVGPILRGILRGSKRVPKGAPSRRSMPPHGSTSAAARAALLERAEQDDADAQNDLGLMYANGQEVPQDYAKATKWFRKAAEQGNAAAQYNLGVMYAKGQGVPQDYAEAVRWYRKGAEQGHAMAQYALAFRYYKGQGVPQDYGQAAKWYRKAAEQGDAGAQNNLGVMYAKGQGVPQDHVEAVRWYRKAAEQGNAGAQNNLSAKYAKGQGVPQDYAEAHKWLDIAASTGDRDQAAKNRDLVAKRMTPAQVAEAQRLAREWMGKFREARKK